MMYRINHKGANSSQPHNTFCHEGFAYPPLNKTLSIISTQNFVYNIKAISSRSVIFISTRHYIHSSRLVHTLKGSLLH